MIEITFRYQPDSSPDLEEQTLGGFKAVPRTGELFSFSSSKTVYKVNQVLHEYGFCHKIIVLLHR